MASKTKLILIYSAGFDNIGIDDLSADRKGIYVYTGSYSEIERANDGDIVVFFQTGQQRAYMFVFQESHRIFENNSLYLEFPAEHSAFDCSIDEFKNFYFVDIDAIRSWVRSPLSSGRNILLLEPRHLLENFLNFSVLRDAFLKKEIFLRTYEIAESVPAGVVEPEQVVLLYDPIARTFGQERSIFAPAGRDIPITGLSIESIIRQNEAMGGYLLKNYQSIKRLKHLSVHSYVRYYDLTRGSRIIKELCIEKTVASPASPKAETAPSEPLPTPAMAMPQTPDTTAPEESSGAENETATLASQSIESLHDAEQMIEQASIEKERLSVAHREKVFALKKSTEEEISRLKHQVDSLRMNYTLEYFLNKSAVDELGYDRADYYSELEDGKFVASKSSFFDFFGNRLKKLNYVLPALRVSYLGQWKETVSGDAALTAREKSEEMRKIIEKFDDILTEDQKRAQKSTVFRWLMGFLFFETVAVFATVYMMRLDYGNMALLIGATLAQITVVIYHIVKNLYPVDSTQVEKLPLANLIPQTK